ncbi:MAG: hypothetical protein Kow00120_06340 [Anaerolineae bacterium]
MPEYRVWLGHGSATHVVTDDVVSAEWTVGFANPDDRMATRGEATIRLRNTDRKYSPAVTPGTVFPGQLVRIEGKYDFVDPWQHLFRGVITRIDPGFGTLLEPFTTITAHDGLGVLLQLNYRGSLMVNMFAADVFESVMDSLPAYDAAMNTPSGPVWWWDSGLEFGVAGDTWRSEEFAATDALREVAESDYGRIWCARDGQMTFYSHTRMHIQGTVVSGTIDNTMQQMYNEYSIDDIYNRARVTYTPRQWLGGTVTLWTQRSVLELPANSERTVTARFADEKGRRFGAEAVLPLVAYTDYELNSKPTGDEYDYTTGYTQLSISVTPHAESADIRFVWGSVSALEGTVVLGPIYVTALQLRGTGVVATYDKSEASYTNAASTATYGLREIEWPAPLVSTSEHARAMAEYICSQYSEPRPRSSVRLINRDQAMHELILETELLDNLYIAEDQSGIAGTFTVTRQSHKLRENMHVHEVEYDLWPVDVQRYWLLGVAGRSELGETTRLGFDGEYGTATFYT